MKKVMKEACHRCLCLKCYNLSCKPCSFSKFKNRKCNAAGTGIIIAECHWALFKEDRGREHYCPV